MESTLVRPQEVSAQEDFEASNVAAASTEMSGMSLDGEQPEVDQEEDEKEPEGPKVVFVSGQDEEAEERDLFPMGSIALPHSQADDLVKKMSTIKGSVKRQGSVTRAPSVKEIGVGDIDVAVEDGQMFITLPWQVNVPLATMVQAVTRTDASSVTIDLQGSSLVGGVWDVRHLSNNPGCSFVVENGVLEVSELTGAKGESKFNELDISIGTGGFSLNACTVEMTACSAVGSGTFVMTAGSQVKMVDCEITEMEGVGIIVSASKLEATRSKFVDHGQSNMEVAEGSDVNLFQCDFIGAKKGEGLLVKGKGTKVYVHKSTFINNETNSMTICDGAVAKVEDCVSFNPQSQSGIEIKDKGTKVKILRSEFLNSHLHGMHVSSGAQCTVDGTFCRGCAGFGVVVEGYVSKLAAVSCIFSDNDLGGAAVTSQGTGVFRGCTISGTKTGHGVELHGKGVDGQMISCKITGNNSSGILVRDGAVAALRDVQSSNSKTSCGLEVDGKGSEVWVTRGQYTDNPEGGVVVNDGKVFN